MYQSFPSSTHSSYGGFGTVVYQSFPSRTYSSYGGSYIQTFPVRSYSGWGRRSRRTYYTNGSHWQPQTSDVQYISYSEPSSQSQSIVRTESTTPVSRSWRWDAGLSSSVYVGDHIRIYGDNTWYTLGESTGDGKRHITPIEFDSSGKAIGLTSQQRDELNQAIAKVKARNHSRIKVPIQWNRSQATQYNGGGSKGSNGGGGPRIMPPADHSSSQETTRQKTQPTREKGKRYTDTSSQNKIVCDYSKIDKNDIHPNATGNTVYYSGKKVLVSENKIFLRGSPFLEEVSFGSDGMPYTPKRSSLSHQAEEELAQLYGYLKVNPEKYKMPFELDNLFPKSFRSRVCIDKTADRSRARAGNKVNDKVGTKQKQSERMLALATKTLKEELEDQLKTTHELLYKQPEVRHFAGLEVGGEYVFPNRSEFIVEQAHLPRVKQEFPDPILFGKKCKIARKYYGGEDRKVKILGFDTKRERVLVQFRRPDREWDYQGECQNYTSFYVPLDEFPPGENSWTGKTFKLLDYPRSQFSDYPINRTTGVVNEVLKPYKSWIRKFVEGYDPSRKVNTSADSYGKSRKIEGKIVATVQDADRRHWFLSDRTRTKDGGVAYSHLILQTPDGKRHRIYAPDYVYIGENATNRLANRRVLGKTAYVGDTVSFTVKPSQEGDAPVLEVVDGKNTKLVQRSSVRQDGIKNFERNKQRKIFSSIALAIVNKKFQKAREQIAKLYDMEFHQADEEQLKSLLKRMPSKELPIRFSDEAFRSLKDGENPFLELKSALKRDPRAMNLAELKAAADQALKFDPKKKPHVDVKFGKILKYAPSEVRQDEVIKEFYKKSAVKQVLALEKRRRDPKSEKEKTDWFLKLQPASTVLLNLRYVNLSTLDDAKYLIDLVKKIADVNGHLGEIQSRTKDNYRQAKYESGWTSMGRYQVGVWVIERKIKEFTPEAIKYLAEPQNRPYLHYLKNTLGSYSPEIAVLNRKADLEK